MPVNVTGFDAAPEAGDSFYVLPDIAQARVDRRPAAFADAAEVAWPARRPRSRSTNSSGDWPPDDWPTRPNGVVLNLIIRADVRGSIEAIQKELGKLEHPEVQIKILQASVGGITVADVTLAHASQAVIIGFNVIPDEAARSLAEDRQVEIRRYDIIYKVTDDIRALLEGKLKPEENESSNWGRRWSNRSSPSVAWAPSPAAMSCGARSNGVAASASIATAGRSATTRWNRCVARRTTSRKSPAAWNAASSCPASTT